MIKRWVKEVQKRIKGIPYSSGRSQKFGKISFDDLNFVPAQVAKRPVDYYRDNISAKTIIGQRSRKPIELETPIIIGAMSFGALSREAKIALAKASTLVGTIANSGEGGILPEERKFAKRLIVQYSTGRFGIQDNILREADAIEIKIGQGAKPGSGGFLPKEKVTKEIAKIRNVPEGKDIHSPAYHLDIKDIEDLRKKIDWLRDLTKGVPVIVKIAGGEIEEDIKLLVKANPDIIAIDGMEGGTGAGSEVLMDELGIPTLPSLVRARKILDKLEARQELWIGGGLHKGSDFSKALALGADAIFISFPLLVATGCVYCKQCYLGKCPRGVATQNPELRKNLDIGQAAENIAKYIKNCTEEMKIIAGACGENNIHNLNSNYLRALKPEIAQGLGIKYIFDP